MSERNVDLVRAAVEAFNRGDLDRFLENASPDFELDLSRATGPEHGVYSLERARQLLRDFSASWESLRIEGDDYREIGDDVVVPQTLRAKGRDGIEVPSRVAWVWTIRDGEIVRASMYQELDEAVDAARD